MTVDFGVTRVDRLSADRRSAIERREGDIAAVADNVTEIVDTVRREGDEALRKYASAFDDVDLEAGELSIDPRAHDPGDVDPAVRSAIATAADNIRGFHRRQRPQDWRTSGDGRELGRRFRPIRRVGVYVPGGDAAYPSSALMGVIPAVVAGVEEIVVVTPPAAKPNPITMAAISEAGADEVYHVGGAQAIAALAYGTETIDPVEKIVGPGNRYVAAAKRAVQGDVAIDFVAGPSEILVLADAGADPELVAADILAQAEHDGDATGALVTDDAPLAEAVVEAIQSQLTERERASTIREALAGPASGAFLAASLDEAAIFAERYAPEHLSIVAASAETEEALLDAVPSAGSVFLGSTTPVAAGDYATGTNHILPTGGWARANGGVSVDTFLRASTVQRLSSEGLGRLTDTITTLATAEGLEAHAASVRLRIQQQE